MSTTTAPLRSAAMIASIADPGVRTTKAPFGHALNALAAADDRIVGLTADLGKYTDMHIFAREYPNRFFEMGMAEQVMMMAAAGMAQTGLIPFASTYSVFATRRAYDFICLDMAEPKLNVNLVSALPGLTTGYGPSHQATEDVAILRGMPDLIIVDPCDAVDIEQAVPQLAATEGPTYTRLLRGAVPRILDDYDYTFELGKAKVVRPGDDVVFVASGLMTMRALLAAEELSKKGVEVCVVHAPTLKPFDEETVVAQVDTDRPAYTLENHTVVGGLFESVASALIKRGIGRKVGAIGLPDAFLDAGALPTLHDRYGLSTQAVVARVLSEGSAR
ncbi:MAG TPA: transketolase C-terminal domain-containing protein [Propioniciclava sp.]|jgi:transketolase|uniref:transketolase family protein n=1 Tax=Propioniciclava sp. TaxID=2038686 RepID=UPI002C7D9429|nr:transketolase C-terminal domain-containing protein [Propioniciclava sp.]HRL49112.1 transketolase C-terminal domain-containing protein [Propioniciclava sp.]HRL79341.1 transketolase C-terminal domain-containing protein [Propioniciclava sp.]